MCVEGRVSKGLTERCAFAPDGTLYQLITGTLQTAHAPGWRFWGDGSVLSSDEEAECQALLNNAPFGATCEGCTDAGCGP